MWLLAHIELRANLQIRYVLDFLYHQLGLVLGKSSSSH